MLRATGQQHLGRTLAAGERTDYSIRQDIVNFKRGDRAGVNSKCRVRTSLSISNGSLLCLVIAGLWTWVSPAIAEEPRTAKEPRLMAESTEITQVADAFDDDDPIDVNLSIGYQYSSRSADILREAGTSNGFYTRGTDKIAQYKESTNRLLMRADIGLFHDLALVVRMPVILSNSQSLGDYAGNTTQAESLRSAAGDKPLFALPFSSPSRHGIEYLALGLDLGLMNQYRDHTKPTWIVGVESRFSVGAPMHACNANPPAGEVSCASPGDVDRNGRQDDTALNAPCRQRRRRPIPSRVAVLHARRVLVAAQRGSNCTLTCPSVSSTSNPTVAFGCCSSFQIRGAIMASRTFAATWSIIRRFRAR